MTNYRLLGSGAATAVLAVIFFVPSQVAVASVPRITASQAFAGYLTPRAVHFATAKFRLPAIKCTTTAREGLIPDVYLQNLLTKLASSGGVYLICHDGVPKYFSYSEINNSFSNFTQTVRAGDMIKVSVSVSSTATSIIVNDQTTGSKVTRSGGGGDFLDASFGNSEVGRPAEPVPQFGSITFSNISVNGLTLKASGALYETDLYSGTTLLVSTGPVSSTGNSFTTTFVRST